MEELLKQIESKVAVIKHSIARNEKYRDFAHPSDISHHFRLLSFHIELGDWEAILKLVLKYKNSRCQVIEKQSVVFQNRIDLQKRSPGFVTQQTLDLMIEYMKQLEWKIDALNGIWKEV